MPAETRGTESAPIRFEAVVATIDGTDLVRLPAEASRRLPSRGQVAVRGLLDGHPFETVVEPDGRRGHWVRIDHRLRQATGIEPGDAADVTLTVAPDWPEPEVPDDLATAVRAAPASIREVWDDITPMARWEWVRWIQATANPETRQRRVEVSISKLDAGKRRPCCFDLSSCTDPALARGGKLREPK